MPAGLGLEFAEGRFHRRTDKTVEKRSACEGPEGKAPGIEQRAGQHGFVQVMPGRHPSPRVAEQQSLGLGRRFDRIIRRAQQGVDLGRRHEPDVLRSERRLLAVHDNHCRYQRFFGNAPSDVGEVDGLLNVCGKKYTETCIGTEMHGLVPGAGRGAVRRRGTGADVQHERHVFPCGRNQQVLGCCNIGT